jgi:hypothetical protein
MLRFGGLSQCSRAFLPSIVSSRVGRPVFVDLDSRGVAVLRCGTAGGDASCGGAQRRRWRTYVRLTVKVAVPGLVVAHHHFEVTTALQIPTTPWTQCGFLSRVRPRVWGLEAVRRVAAPTPPPRPQRLSSGPGSRGESNQDLLLANSRLDRRLRSTCRLAYATRRQSNGRPLRRPTRSAHEWSP